MIFSKRTISDLLVHSEQMIGVALADDDIKKALLDYNFTEELLKEGKKIYDTADQLSKERTSTYGKKLEASAQVRRAKRKAHNAFMQHVNFARVIHKDDPEKLAKLKIHGYIEKKFTAWFFQVDQFYSAALKDEELIREIAKFGITREKLEQDYQLVKDAGKAKEKHMRLDGKSQDLKAERDKALDKLDDWITGFAMVCRYALVDNPQLLEKLGITVYSPGYKKPTDEKKKNQEKEGNPEEKEEVKEETE